MTRLASFVMRIAGRSFDGMGTLSKSVDEVEEQEIDVPGDFDVGAGVTVDSGAMLHGVHGAADG